MSSLALAVPGVGVGDCFGFSFSLAILSRRFVLLVWALLPGVSSGRQIYFTLPGVSGGCTRIGVIIWAHVRFNLGVYIPLSQARGFTVHHRPGMVGINPALPFR